MVAYIVVDTEIENPDAYEEYKLMAKPLVEKYGGSYLARGGDLDVKENDRWTPVRVVILQFPDMDTARRFTDSEEYAPAKALRRANAKCTVAIVDGI